MSKSISYPISAHSNERNSYAPTAVHWSFLLTSLQLLGPTTGRNFDLVALKCSPSIIILHEPSQLFKNSNEKFVATSMLIYSEIDLVASPEVSQYLLLLMHAFSLASYFEKLTPGYWCSNFASISYLICRSKG